MARLHPLDKAKSASFPKSMAKNLQYLTRIRGFIAKARERGDYVVFTFKQRLGQEKGAFLKESWVKKALCPYK